MERILILDFGGQYNQLIAHLAGTAECKVYYEGPPHTPPWPVEDIRVFSPIGIIFTGARAAYMRRGPPGRSGGLELWDPCAWDLLRLSAAGPSVGRTGDPGSERIPPESMEKP